MARYAEGDLIRVFKNSGTHVAQGLRGFVDDIRQADGKTVYYLHALDNAGNLIGGGVISEDCVISDSSPGLRESYRLYQETLEGILNEVEERGRQYAAVRVAVAKDYRLSENVVEKIHKTMSNWEQFYIQHLKTLEKNHG